MNSDPLSLFKGAKTRRWTSQKKARVVTGIGAGKITFEKAVEAYDLSTRELLDWQHRHSISGIKGLQVYHIQQHSPK